MPPAEIRTDLIYTPDWNYWTKVEGWTLLEAALLVCSDPNDELRTWFIATLNRYWEPPPEFIDKEDVATSRRCKQKGFRNTRVYTRWDDVPDDMLPEFCEIPEGLPSYYSGGRLYDEAERAARTGALQVTADGYVRPAEFIAFAADKGYAIPGPLQPLLPKLAALAALAALPKASRWDDITFICHVNKPGVLVVKVGNVEPHECTPLMLGLENKKTGKPCMPWKMLDAIVYQGEITKAKTVNKNVERLNKALKKTFGISSAPIRLNNGSYRPAFRVEVIEQARPQHRLSWPSEPTE